MKREERKEVLKIRIHADFKQSIGNSGIRAARKEGKMRKVFTGLILLTGLLLLAACDNDPLNLPQVTEPAPGMGRLTVALDGTAGRTLLPQAPEFSRYALRFRYMAGGVSDINETADTLPFSIELLPGNWNVTVTSYVYIENVEGIVNGHYIAASGEKTVTIEANISTPVTVDLYRRSGVKGVFQYDIGLPATGLNGANLNILRTDRTEVTTKNLLEAASGSIALDEGYYFVQVRVLTGRARSKTELIHIYSGHTTVAGGAAWDFDTEEGVFLSATELSEYLSYAQANTVDNPYELKLTVDWESLSVPISGGDEALGQLFRALHGRYARLDLSDVTGVMGDTYTAYPERLSGDRDKLVSVILPEDLTQIGDGAFYGCTSLEQITLPDAVESIGDYAFYGCTGLTGVTIPDSVTGIGSSAFGNCKNLTVTIQTDKVSNWSNIFSNNTVLSVIFGDGITSVGNSAFSGCTGLASITIPDSVTSIGSSAFFGCTGLKNVIIGNGVTSLNGFSFSGNTNLTSVIIGNKVTSIGNSAFDGCTGLTDVTIPDSVTSIGNSAFDGCTGLIGITIPDSVTGIGNYAFRGCAGLTSVTIPNSVTSIANNIFYDCSGLTSIIIPDSVTRIGNSAFSGCTGLTGVTIPDSVTSIGDSAFSGCTGLAGITIPDSVTNIANNTFFGCTGLTSVTIPDNVTSIGQSAFYDCIGLTSITIPDSVTGIGSSAFYGCTGLTGVIIGNSVTSIESSAFSGCIGLTSITIPDNVTGIGNNAFNGCNGLENVIIGNGVTSLNGFSFSGNTNLISVTIGNKITSIGSSAFSGCTGLTGITIPDSVTGIGNSAFSGCTGLTGITIPDSVTSIGTNAFNGCSGLFNVTFNGTIPSSGFSSTSPFPGDLRTKYLAGGPGTYITTNPGSGAVWTKGNIASITAPSWHEGNAISLVTPLIVLPAGETVTAQGWQISDNAGDGWTNFSLSATADMSYHGKYLRYYAAFSGGQTYYSNEVIIIVIQTVVVTNTGEWNAAVNTIRNGGNDHSYIIYVSGNVGITGSAADTFGAVTGLSVTLQGNGRLYLTSRGRIITLAADQTLIIDSADLVLQGLKNGQNGATQDNNTAVVYVNGSNAQLELRNGTISGNSSGSGGGVYVVSSGTFTMNGGKISGNSASSYGGGVYVVSSGTFTMSDGEISGNSAYSGGGGVCVSGGTFRIVTGTVYGSDASPTTLRNTVDRGGAALQVQNSGTVQYGTFSGETWVRNGFLSLTNNTINVVNGVLQ